MSIFMINAALPFILTVKIGMKASPKTSTTSAGKRPSTFAALELQRLDDLYTKAWDLVDAGGSETAIDRCLRIMERPIKASSGSTLLRRSNIPATRDQPPLPVDNGSPG